MSSPNRESETEQTELKMEAVHSCEISYAVCACSHPRYQCEVHLYRSIRELRSIFSTSLAYSIWSALRVYTHIHIGYQ